MKYIINTDDLYGGDIYKSMLLMGANGKGEVIVQKFNLDELEELNSDYINEHFGSLQDYAYQRGFEDGKAVHEKGCEGCKYQANRELTCPCSECANNYKNQWTAKDDKIEVGDEVKLCSHKESYVVTSYEQDNDKCILMSVRGGFFRAEKCDIRKTGRHFDIHKILKEMKE